MILLWYSHNQSQSLMRRKTVGCGHTIVVRVRGGCQVKTGSLSVHRASQMKVSSYFFSFHFRVCSAVGLSAFFI